MNFITNPIILIVYWVFCYELNTLCKYGRYNNNLYIKEDLYIPLKNSETGMLISKIKLEKLKNYEQDDKVGYIEIYIDDELLTTKDIYVNKECENKTQSFWSKLWEWIKFW